MPSAPTPHGRWVAATFLAGFCLLALEVVWFRFLLLFVKGSSDAFPVMLAVVLAGIAMGGLAASLWMRAAPGAYRFAPALALAAGIATVASYAAFPSVIAPFGLTSITRPAATLRISIPLMLPVSFVSGLFFPISGFLKTIQPIWPTFHLAQLARASAGLPSQGSIVQHLAILAAVTLVLTFAAARKLARTG